jgi:transposase
MVNCRRPSASGRPNIEGTMRKLQIEDSGGMRIAIQQEIARSEDARYYHRLHGLLLLAAGHSCREVAELFGEDDTTVQRWVHRFERGGLRALRESLRPGRPRSLAPEQWRELETDLRRSPLDFGFAVPVWDGISLSEHLRRRFAVRLGVRQCQRIFRQLGLRTRESGKRVLPQRSDEDRRDMAVGAIAQPT